MGWGAISIAGAAQWGSELVGQLRLGGAARLWWAESLIRDALNSERRVGTHTKE
jgi:hypothetical protein